VEEEVLTHDLVGFEYADDNWVRLRQVVDANLHGSRQCIASLVRHVQVCPLDGQIVQSRSLERVKHFSRLGALDRSIAAVTRALRLGHRKARCVHEASLRRLLQ